MQLSLSKRQGGFNFTKKVDLGQVKVSLNVGVSLYHVIFISGFECNAKIKLRNGGPMFGPGLQRQIAGAVSCPGWLYRALIMQITDNRGAIVSLELFTP